MPSDNNLRRIVLGVGCLTSATLIFQFMAVRLLSAVSVAPLGFLMGLAFPVGIKLFTVNKADLTPWFWGVSSAASVVGSLLAVVLPLNYGLSASWWIGMACYLCSASLGYVYFKIARRTNFEQV